MNAIMDANIFGGGTDGWMNKLSKHPKMKAKLKCFKVCSLSFFSFSSFHQTKFDKYSQYHNDCKYDSN